MATRNRPARRRSAPAPMSSEERAAKVEALSARLADAVTELATGEQWTAMLRAAAAFHRYSFRNVLLLWAQAEERGATLTQVAGFQAWRTLGRTVRKGEKGYQVLAPRTRRRDDDVVAEAAPDAPPTTDAGGSPGRVMCGVKIAHVFDIAQTDGEPLPSVDGPQWLTGDDPAGLGEALAALIAADGYELVRRPETGDTQGWTNYTERIVSVRPDIDAAATAAVLAHELGHIRADHEHRRVSRAQRETEAESIAFVVLTACDLDSAAAAVPYIAGWNDGDPEVIAAATETVHRAAAAILADLEHAAAPRTDQTGTSDAHAAAAGRDLLQLGARA